MSFSHNYCFNKYSKKLFLHRQSIFSDGLYYFCVIITPPLGLKWKLKFQFPAAASVNTINDKLKTREARGKY